MGIRDTLNQNQNIVVVVAVVILVTALIYIFFRSTGSDLSRRQARAYYKDVVTGEVFTAETQKIPPIQSPDGNQAVLVRFFSCTDDCGKDDRFVGYYMKYTEEIKRRLEEQREEAEQQGEEMSVDSDTYELWEESERALLAALPKQGGEVDLTSEGAWTPRLELVQAIEERLVCDDGDRARPCFPR